jgi:hypothetical protein
MKASHVIVTGQTGTGKTRWIANHIKEHLDEYDKVLVFDAQYDLQGKPELSSLLRRKCAHTRRDIEELLPGDILCFSPWKLCGTDIWAAMVSFIGICRAVRGKKLLVIDELQKYGGHHDALDELVDVYQTGRRDGIHTLAGAAAPTGLHTDILGSVDRIIAFRSVSRSAVQFLARYGVRDAHQLRNREYYDIQNGLISKERSE